MRRWAAGLVLAAMTLGLMAQTGRAAELELAAPSSILMEKTTGEVLYEDNADEKLRPASVTKVMTLLLVMEALEDGRIGWDDMVTTSAAAAAKGGSQIYLEESRWWFRRQTTARARWQSISPGARQRLYRG